jgi:hypothetical protein
MAMLDELSHIEVRKGIDVSSFIDFIQEVKDIVLQDDEISMSFDVSLFPSIPISVPFHCQCIHEDFRIIKIWLRYVMVKRYVGILVFYV